LPSAFCEEMDLTSSKSFAMAASWLELDCIRRTSFNNTFNGRFECTPIILGDDTLAGNGQGEVNTEDIGASAHSLA
jgi:hypothetical protein